MMRKPYVFTPARQAHLAAVHAARRGVRQSTCALKLVHKAIAELRDVLATGDYSQRRAARALGVRESTIRRWLSGNCQPKTETLALRVLKWADAQQTNNNEE
jgi:DNA-binding transcriptional regulator YiaG